MSYEYTLMARPASPAPSDVTVFRSPDVQFHSPEIAPLSPLPADPPDLHRIRTDRIVCPASCVCKLRGRHTKHRSPAVEAISHKVKGGICFLLCILESQTAAPTYLRQCEVPKEVRLEYHTYLRKYGRPKNLDDYWNPQKELEMRDALFAQLTTKEQRIQTEIVTLTDTGEWDKRTNNGRTAPAAVTPPLAEDVVCVVADSLHPGPASTTDSAHFWLIERVIGSLLTMEDGRPRRWFLIKWEGWESSENSWEPEKKKKAGPSGADMGRCDGVDATSSVVKEFHKEYGKPSVRRPKILSPEGEEYEVARALADEGTDCTEAQVITEGSISDNMSSTSSKKRRGKKRAKSSASMVGKSK